MKINIIGRTDHKSIEYEANADGCWICTSHRKTKGYPTIQTNGKAEQMSRFIYRHFIGQIPENHVIRHKCDNRACINPDHLETGTTLDNMQDKVDRNRQARLPGELNGRAKLNLAQVEEIRKDARTQKEIASHYKISTRQVRGIKNRESWRTE